MEDRSQHLPRDAALTREHHQASRQSVEALLGPRGELDEFHGGSLRAGGQQPDEMTQLPLSVQRQLEQLLPQRAHGHPGAVDEARGVGSLVDFTSAIPCARCG